MQNSYRLRALFILFSWWLTLQFAGAEAKNLDGTAAESNVEPASSEPVFLLSRLAREATREFGKAWRTSGCGISKVEGLVLIYKGEDGTYSVRAKRPTNEFRKVTFTMTQDVVAIIHTHPNDRDPRPTPDDMKVSDRFGVPIFTITFYGMYMYLPASKKTFLVQKGLDWLDAEKWTQVVAFQPI